MRIHGVLFTDLDGTLLDFETYQPSIEAKAALAELFRVRVLTIPVSSKTAAEVLPLMKNLELRGPAVFEGGAVVANEVGKLKVLGMSSHSLQEVLARLKGMGWDLRGMSDMSNSEIVDLTGLEPRAAELAANRLASEPFLARFRGSDQNQEKLAEAAETLGTGVVRGGRFWHLLGSGVDKATGISSVLEILNADTLLPTAAVGDAWNDLAMLATVDHAYILGDSVEDTDLPAGVIRISRSGPEGFTEAVGKLLNSWGLSV